jgi:hypothetical protein
MSIKGISKFLVYLMAAGIAIGCVTYGYYLHSEHLISQEKLAGMWLRICYPVLIVFSFLVSLFIEISPWILAIVLSIGTSISITNMFGSQAPPFEILLFAVLAIPYILASYIGLFINQRRKNIRGQSKNSINEWRH